MKVIVLSTSFVVCLLNSSIAQVDEFVETFSGNGPFASVEGRLNGFENPGWNLLGNCGADGACDVSLPSVAFNDRGLRLENVGNSYGEGDYLQRTLEGNGSFIERLELTDVLLRPSCGVCSGGGAIGLSHFSASLSIRESNANSDGWRISLFYGERFVGSVETGTDVAMSIVHDETHAALRFRFDNNTKDDVRPITFGPFPSDHLEFSDSRSQFRIGATDAVDAHGTLTYWSFRNFSGDFNQDNLTDVMDITLLNDAISSMNHDDRFDLDSDRKVDAYDRDIWVWELANTSFGDANLDGQFNSSDLVDVLAHGEFEDDVPRNSIWATGDWNGDGEFDTSDLVMAFEDGGYERQPQVTAVPEPSSVALAVLFLVSFFRFFVRHAYRAKKEKTS